MPFPASAYNTFVPSPESTGYLVTGWSRNPEMFPVGSYAQYIPTSQMIFMYMNYTSQQQARIIEDDGSEFLWNDGQRAPTGTGNTDTFEWVTDRTQRYVYPWTIGNLAIEQAEFPIVSQAGKDVAQQAMTHRTMLAISALRNASWGANTSTVAAITGGPGKNWTNGFSTAPYIKQCLNYATIQIHLATNGAVKAKDMPLIVNPTLASLMGQSPEIHDYCKSSPFVEAQIRGDAPNLNSQYGLPTMLYGHPLIVEDTVRISSKKGAASLVQTFVLGSTDAFMVSRPGGLQGIEGGNTYSTLQMYYHKDELSSYTKNNPDDELTEGRVVSNYKFLIPRNQTGFYFSACQT